MRIDGKWYRTIFLGEDGWTVRVIDQTQLPFALVFRDLATVQEAAAAIRDMVVRGAPLIGVTAAYGIALAMHEDPGDASLQHALDSLAATRPTAVNLRWALEKMRAELGALAPGQRTEHAYMLAGKMADEDAATCAAIGRHGLEVLRRHRDPSCERPLRVLTHCNAGWLACVDWGTALAPVYAAHEAGMAVEVIVDETRPRNQGAALTAFELGAQGVPFRVVVDNAGGHLMQHGDVDLCIVGSDRTTARGGQQDRHVSQGARGAGQRDSLLCRAAVVDHRLVHAGRSAGGADRRTCRAGGHSCQGTRRRRQPARGRGRGPWKSGKQPGFRRDSGPAHHRHHHGAGPGAGVGRRIA